MRRGRLGGRRGDRHRHQSGVAPDGPRACRDAPGRARRDLAPEAMLGCLAEAMQRWLAAGTAAPASPACARPGSSMPAPVGESLTVDTGRERIAGTFLDLDDGGALLMRDAQGQQRKLTFGDVTLAQAAAEGSRLMANDRAAASRRRRARVHGARRHRRDRHELLSLRPGAGRRAPVADGRSRHHLPRGRERSRHRRHPARSALHRGGAGEPRRPRPHPRARGPHRRGHRAVAAAARCRSMPLRSRRRC